MRLLEIVVHVLQESDPLLQLFACIRFFANEIPVLLFHDLHPPAENGERGAELMQCKTHERAALPVYFTKSIHAVYPRQNEHKDTEENSHHCKEDDEDVGE
ncbi:MAG: hypothetical protein UY85_C0052G0010, partial [Candidatus Peribacteria bacterium GW2011_GWB1_54_5]